MLLYSFNYLNFNHKDNYSYTFGYMGSNWHYKMMRNCMFVSVF